MIWVCNTDTYPDRSVNYTMLIKLKTGLNNLYGDCVKLDIDVAKDPRKVIQNFEISKLNESITDATRSKDDYILIFIANLYYKGVTYIKFELPYVVDSKND